MVYVPEGPGLLADSGYSRQQVCHLPPSKALDLCAWYIVQQGSSALVLAQLGGPPKPCS